MSDIAALAARHGFCHSGGAAVLVASVTVAPDTLALQVGERATLVATPRDASRNALSGHTAVWSSAAPGIATVDAATGQVTAVAAGSVVITATVDGVPGTAAVTVTAATASVASVEVSPSVVSLQPGQQAQLDATPKDAAGNALPNRAVTWASGNEAIATVSSTGLVTAVADGGVTITATCEGVDGTASITVTTVAGAIVEDFTGDLSAWALTRTDPAKSVTMTIEPDAAARGGTKLVCRMQTAQTCTFQWAAVPAGTYGQMLLEGVTPYRSSGDLKALGDAVDNNGALAYYAGGFGGGNGTNAQKRYGAQSPSSNNYFNWNALEKYNVLVDISDEGGMMLVRTWIWPDDGVSARTAYAQTEVRASKIPLGDGWWGLTWWASGNVNQEAWTVERITFSATNIAPSPVQMKDAHAKVIARGRNPYPLTDVVPGADGLTLAFDWDFDLDNPGVYTSTDRTPRNFTLPSEGTRRWRCTATQNNGAEVTIFGSWDAWEMPSATGYWPEVQDYTTPSYACPAEQGTAGYKTYYVDADAASDGDGLSELTPMKLLATLNTTWKAGELALLKGDFSQQNESLNLPAGGGPSVWTKAGRWPGAAAQPRLTGRADWVGGSTPYNKAPPVISQGHDYLVVDDLFCDGRHLGSIEGVDTVHLDANGDPRTVGTHGIDLTDSSNTILLNCLVSSRGNGVRWVNGRNNWAEDCTTNECGTDVTVEKDNGGDGFWIQSQTDSTVYHCNLLNSGHAALTIAISGGITESYRVRVAYCTVNNLWAGPADMSGGAFGCLFEHNDVIDTGQSPSKGYVGSENGVNVRGVLNEVRRCRISRATRQAIFLQTNTLVGDQQCISNWVHHNSLYQCGCSVQLQSYGGRQAGRTIACHDNIIENNLSDQDCFQHAYAYANGVIPKNADGSTKFNLYQGWVEGVKHHIMVLLGDGYALDNELNWGVNVSTNTIGPSLGGNLIRHNAFRGAYANVQFAVFGAPSGMNNVHYATPAAFEAAFPACKGNLHEVDPQWAAADPLDTTDPAWMTVAPTSPVVGAGYPAPGDTYTSPLTAIGWPAPTYAAVGGASDIGWQEQ